MDIKLSMKNVGRLKLSRYLLFAPVHTKQLPANGTEIFVCYSYILCAFWSSYRSEEEVPGYSFPSNEFQSNFNLTTLFTDKSLQSPLAKVTYTSSRHIITISHNIYYLMIFSQKIFQIFTLEMQMTVIHLNFDVFCGF